MSLKSTLRVLFAGGWLASSSCTSLRELPRGEYAARAERQHVRVETSDGRRYDFDYARFGNDTLTGFHSRDVEGRFEQADALPIPLDDVAHLSARRFDWYRTGLIGAGAAVAVVVAVIAQGKKDEAPSDGGGKPPPTRPAP